VTILGSKVPYFFGNWLRCFQYLIKNKININFVIFMAAKLGKTTKFFPTSFVAVVGSGIRDPGCIKIRIWDLG
jgi:hypothetical protein